MLELSSLHKVFPGAAAAAVDGVSLSVRQGETLAIIGGSGSGKSTILRLISGLENPTGGSIFINGECVSSSSSCVEPHRRPVGMVFQEYALFPHLTVEQNIAFGLHSLSSVARRERVAAMLSTVGLLALADRYPHQLSGGQQQRVALARALAPSPKILLLDEPFSNLDVGLQSAVRTEVHDLLKSVGTTTIIVTHDVDDAFAVADVVALMDRGILIQSGAPSAVYATPTSLRAARLMGECTALRGKRGHGDTVLLGGHEMVLRGRIEGRGEEVLLLFRPHELSFSQSGSFAVRITDCRFAGSYYRVEFTVGGDVHIAHCAEPPPVLEGDCFLVPLTAAVAACSL